MKQEKNFPSQVIPQADLLITPDYTLVTARGRDAVEIFPRSITVELPDGSEVEFEEVIRSYKQKAEEPFSQVTPSPDHIFQVIRNTEIAITPNGTYLLGKDGSMIGVFPTAITVNLDGEGVSLEELLEDHKTLENQKGE